MTEEEINLTIKLEEEALERERFLDYALDETETELPLMTVIDWIDENFEQGASFEANLVEFKRFEQRKSRTGKQSATLVEKVVRHILAEKRKKRDEILKTAKKGTQPKIPKEWFNELISKTCYDNNISEGHIRAVGVWNVNEEVDSNEPND
jgi:hypothetical protein